MKLKKILASVISVAMMLSTMGFTALAAGEVAFIDDVGFATLQEAIDAVKDSETIKLVATTDETVMVDNGINFTIDGKIDDDNNVTFNGVIKINEGENFVIRNVNFVGQDGSAYDYLIGNADGTTGKNYNTTLLVDGCSFTGDSGYNTAAVKLKHPTKLTIQNSVGTSLHSLTQNTGGQEVVIDNVTLTDSKRGMSLGGVRKSTVKNSKFIVNDEKYGIRIDAATENAEHKIENCEISAFIPVVVRNASAKNVSVAVDGTNTMTAANTDGIWLAVGTSEYEENGVMPTAPTGKVEVELNDKGLVTDGVYGIKAKVYVAKIGEAKFETLQAAVDAAQNGEAIELLGDVTVEESVVVDGKTLTFNGNDYTVKGASYVEPYGFGVTPFSIKDSDVTFNNISIIGGDTDYEFSNSLGMALEVTDSKVTATNATLKTGEGATSYVVGMPVIMADEESDISLEDVTLYQFDSGYAGAAMVSKAGEQGNVDDLEENEIAVSGTITVAEGSAAFEDVPVVVPAGKTVKFEGNVDAEYMLYVQFRKVDVDANGDDNDEDKDLYDIVIVSKNGKINRLTSADLTFNFDSTAANANTVDPIYSIIPVKPVQVTTNADYEDRYMFSFDGITNPDETGKEIVIGQVEFSGYGEYTFEVDAAVNTEEGRNIVHTTTLDDNIVVDYHVGGLTAGNGDLVINEDMTADDGMVGKIDSEIKVPTRTLTVNVSFPNAVVDNAVAYQDMKVEIAGNIDGVNQTVTYDLGKDGKAMADGSYKVVEDGVVVNNKYTVTVSGAGYRTATYTVMMTEDKTLNFWNNVMDDAKEVEVDEVNSKAYTTFLAGDIVKDANINIYDLSAVVAYFGEVTDTTQKSDYSKYDLNRDGFVDSKDVAYVLVSWGK